MKKYKVVSITYTTSCLKKPRCSFCYLQKQRTLEKLRGIKDVTMLDRYEDNVEFWNSYKKLLNNTEQVAIAYNGIGFNILLSMLQESLGGWLVGVNQKVLGKVVVNITTNPKFIVKHHLAYLKNHSARIGMWALSFDEEKCSIAKWIETAELIKKFKSKVSANILMTDKMFTKIDEVLKQIAQYCDQIHLLRPKFIEVKLPVKVREEKIFLLKQMYPNIFIDECFQWEFTGKPCSRGKDFVSLNPDGSISKCSFDPYNSYKGRLKKCPFI